MTLIIPPGFASASIILTGTAGTPEFVTTIGVDVSAAGGDFVQAANDVMIAYNVAFKSQTWNDLTIDRVSLMVGQDGGDGSVDSDLPPVPCTRSITTPPPVAMAAIARKVTNELGRRGRGRMFLPCVVAESEVGPSGEITPTRQASLKANLDTFYDNLVTTLSGDPVPPVLLHSAAPADPSPITGFAVSPIVGWIRGRIR